MKPGTQFCPQDGAALEVGKVHVCKGVDGVDYSTSMGKAAMNYLGRAGLEPMDLRQSGDHVIFTSMAPRAALQSALPWRELRSLGGTVWSARP